MRFGLFSVGVSEIKKPGKVLMSGHTVIPHAVMVCI